MSMVRRLELFFALGCATIVLCSRESCGSQPGPATEQGATSCGCENLKRAAAWQPVEDTMSSTEPAEKYSRVANEGLSEARAQEVKVQSQVFLQHTRCETQQHEMTLEKGPSAFEKLTQNEPDCMVVQYPAVLSSLKLST